MKKYVEFEMELVTLTAQDIVTLSGFGGEYDGFETPNTNAANDENFIPGS